MTAIRERELADPLSAVTRAERRSVLLTNLVLFALVFGRLTPSKITAFGVEVTRANTRVLIGIITGMAYYFWISFLIYHKADERAWLAEKHDLESEQAADVKNEAAVLTVAKTGGHAEWQKSHLAGRLQSRSIYEVRRWFEFWVPAILGAANPIVCFVGMLLMEP